MLRTSFLRAAAGLTLSLAAGLPFAHAATVSAFTPQAFADAQKAGKPILVEITASWCPTCAKQRPILATLFNEPKYADLQVLNVDFDSQKSDVRALGANMQSTLIVFTGTTEKGRSVGDTNADSIASLVAKSGS